MFRVKSIFMVGSRSILYGAHCWFIHPLFVAAAWWKLFGRPRDPRLWLAFFMHDLGYWGKPDIDGPDGETHPEWAAYVLHVAFDVKHGSDWWHAPGRPLDAELLSYGSDSDMDLRQFWHCLCLYHSRFYARRDGRPYSPLCVADKLAIAVEPWWLYLPRAALSGELWEYMAAAGGRPGSKYNGERELGVPRAEPQASRYRQARQWHRRMSHYCREWAYAHMDGREDTWTPGLHSAGQEGAL